jgi:hypothetical protein
MRSHKCWSAVSGSGKVKIDAAIRKGWAPGRGRVRDFVRSRKKLQQYRGGEE